MRTNKFGNYKLFRTIGEGAFAKVKRKLKNYLSNINYIQLEFMKKQGKKLQQKFCKRVV